MSDVDTPGGSDTVLNVHALRSLLQAPHEAADAGHVERIAASDLSASTKLAALTHLKGAGNDREELIHIATSLVRPGLGDAATRATAELLVDRISDTHGGDPFGRKNLLANDQHDDLLPNLDESISSNSFSIMASCEADRIEIDGKPVLFVETELWTKTPLADLEPVIDPLEWPNCPVQSQFFESMVVQDGVPELLVSPDAGWKATVRETVNFGAEVGKMITDLDMVFSTSEKAIGCTYGFHDSVDGKIQHDEGYLLAQDLGDTYGARRITTMKAVWFTENNTPVDQVCPVWSLSAGLVAHACVREGG